MARRIIDDAIESLAKQYQQLAGRKFNPDSHSGPANLSGPVLDVVKELKILIAGERQIEIMTTLSSFEKRGDAYVLPDDQLHLIEDFNSLKEEVGKWK